MFRGATTGCCHMSAWFAVSPGLTIISVPPGGVNAHHTLCPPPNSWAM